MKANDNVGVTFVNAVIGSGTFNNVINLTLGVCLFTPDPESNKVEDDVVVAARLRMDPLCARQLRDTLTRLLEATAITPPPEEAASNGATSTEAPATETIN